MWGRRKAKSVVKGCLWFFLGKGGITAKVTPPCQATAYRYREGDGGWRNGSLGSSA